MSKTIRVIDLLNKIANGEEVPEKIKNKYVGIMKWNESMKDYKAETSSYWLFFNDCEEPTTKHLNDTVEIIEEQEEIDVQSIEEIEPAMNGNACVIDNKTWTLNQVIKAVKQLEKKIKEKE